MKPVEGSKSSAGRILCYGAMDAESYFASVFLHIAEFLRLNC